MFFYIKKTDDPLFMEYIKWLNNLPDCAGLANGRDSDYYGYVESNCSGKKYYLVYMDSKPTSSGWVEVSLQYWDTCLRGKSPEEISGILSKYKDDTMNVHSFVYSPSVTDIKKGISILDTYKDYVNSKPLTATGTLGGSSATYTGNGTKQSSTVTGTVTSSLSDCTVSGTSISLQQKKGRYDSMVALI